MNETVNILLFSILADTHNTLTGERFKYVVENGKEVRRPLTKAEFYFYLSQPKNRKVRGTRKVFFWLWVLELFKRFM